MAFEDIQNDPDMMQAIRSTGFPQYQSGPGPRPGAYEWLNQIAHAMGLGLMGRGGIGPPRLRRIRPEAAPEYPSRNIGPRNPLEGSDALAKAQPVEQTREAILQRQVPVTERPDRPPKFTPDQLSEVVGQVRSGVEGSMDTLSEMLTGYIGKLSGRFAPRLKSGAMTSEDLTQEGQEVLQRMVSSKTYDPTKPFLPYLKRELVSRFQELMTKSHPMQVGRDEGQLIAKLDRINNLSYKMTGRLRSAEELSKMTGVPEEKIWSIYRGVEDMQKMSSKQRGLPEVEAAGTKDMWQQLWGGQ